MEDSAGVWQLDDSTHQPQTGADEEPDWGFYFTALFVSFSWLRKRMCSINIMLLKIHDVTPASSCGEGVWIKWTDRDIKLNGYDGILELHGWIRHSESLRGWF